MMNFFQSNPDISQRMSEFRINDSALAVASSNHSVLSTSTTRTLRSLNIVLNGTRVYKMANKNTSTTTFKTKNSSFSQLSGRSLSEISDISVIRLPVYALELNNGGLYRRSWRRVALEKIGFENAADPGRIVEKVRRFSLGSKADKQTQRDRLMSAARMGDSTTLLSLLWDGGVDVQMQDGKGRTALHNAAENGQEFIVEFLLNREANIEAQDSDGMTALHLSSREGYGDNVRLLLDRGADIQATGQYGRTAVHCSAEAGHRDTVQLLLDRGAEIQTTDKFGRTALHFSAGAGHRGTAQLLLDRGAEIQTRGRDGQTPLHCSARAGHRDIAQLLLDRGADIQKTGAWNMTALHYSAIAGHRDTVQDRKSVV